MAFDYSLAITAIIITFSLTIIGFFKYRFSYWKRRGIVSPPGEIPFGSVRNFLLRKETLGGFIQKLYEDAKSKGLKHVGYYLLSRPTYVPVDINIIKHILKIDSDAFLNRGIYANEKDDPLSGNLMAIEGEKWKSLRKKLTPIFTTGQIRIMFQTVIEISKKLEDLMENHSHGEPLESKDTVARFTTDIIASCGFGIVCNTLEKRNSEFREYGAKAFEQTLADMVKRIVFLALPFNLLQYMGIRRFSPDISKFFMSVVKDTVSYREANDVYRKDFMHLLLQLKNRGRLVNDGKVNGAKEGALDFTMDELAAQAFIFYLAGFETSSTTTSNALYELAVNQDIQDKLREEINEVLHRHNGQLTYEVVGEMEYLHQIVEETMRKYPVTTQLVRCSDKDYSVPGTDVTLEKGTLVHIPLLALHRDPEYFPNPDVFDPDRFSPENKRRIPQFSYLPFGEGPRICIGLRFGLLQVKVGLVAMLKNYRVTLNPRTQSPLVMEAFSITYTTSSGIWLDIEKIRN